MTSKKDKIIKMGSKKGWKWAKRDRGPKGDIVFVVMHDEAEAKLAEKEKELLSLLHEAQRELFAIRRERVHLKKELKSYQDEFDTCRARWEEEHRKVKDLEAVEAGLRDVICFQCQMLAPKHSKKKPNPSCDDCTNGPTPHNPLQKALDHNKELEAELKTKDELIDWCRFQWRNNYCEDQSCDFTCPWISKCSGFAKIMDAPDPAPTTPKKVK